MILGASDGLAPNGPDAGITIDDLFRSNAARRPDSLALIDPPNRLQVTGDAPRSFTYAQADRAIDAIATRLRDIGLPADAVVAVQLPNVAPSILTLLAVMRAGMIAAPLPLLWRRADCVAALSGAGAKAIVTCGRVGDADHGTLAMEVAAELFPIRAVCGFGEGLADGIVSFDDLLDGTPTPCAPLDRGTNACAHVAAVTFDVTAQGVIPVPRNHSQLLAGGVLVAGESRLMPEAGIVSTMPAASFAGLSAAMLPWLLTGGALVLHHPFDPDILTSQIAQYGCSVLVVPDVLASRLSDSGMLPAAGVKTVISICRSPERFASAPVWNEPEVALVDVAAFGEVALLAKSRSANSGPAPWIAGAVTVTRDGDALEIGHVARTRAGTLGFRGRMVSLQPLASHTDRSAASYFQTPETGHVDTGYPCRMAPDGGALTITAAPAGLVTIGGYRFAIRDLRRMAGDIDPEAVLAALPDGLSGYRLAGHAANASAVQQALHALGLNPLVCEAFRDRAKPA